MSDEKKIVQTEEKQNEKETKEINLDELDEVTGGSLRDAQKKKTSSISDDTRSKI